MRQIYFFLLLSIGISSCKLPELPTALKAKQCSVINAKLTINRDYTKIKDYYFNLDSLKGNVKQIVWKINNQLVQELPRNRSFSYTFANDGSFNIVAEITDSCNTMLKLTKNLIVKTDVYVQPITRFVNNDGTDADIQGMTFDSDGAFRSYIIWNNIPNFYPDKNYKFKDCGGISNGDNGDIGKISAFRYKPETKQYYVFETRNRECAAVGPNIGDYIFRSSPTLKTYSKLAGRNSFELGKNNIFVRGLANVVLVPYNNIEQIPELLFVKDSIKYNFNAYNYKFGKYNENEYLAVSAKPNQYAFVKFFEDSRQSQELFKFNMIENGADGIYLSNNVGIGEIINLCIDNIGEIWILEKKKLIFGAGGTIDGFGKPIDTNDLYRIRKIAKNGTLITIIDNTTAQIAGLIHGPLVVFKNPKCIAYNPKDNAVYFSDGGSYKKIVIK